MRKIDREWQRLEWHWKWQRRVMLYILAPLIGLLFFFKVALPLKEMLAG